MYTVGIITSSDKGAKNEREDKSGKAIKEIVEKYKSGKSFYEQRKKR